MEKEILTDILHSYHLRITDVRLKVLDVLVQSDSALCHHEITESLHNYIADKVTIYRTLNTFEQKGLIHKVASKDRNWQYAICLKKERPVEVDRTHAHFICEQCGRIFCMPVSGLQSLPEADHIDGFKITEKELRYHGLCPDCSSSRNPTNEN